MYEATGIDLNDLNHYKYLKSQSSNCKVFIIFVDEHLGTVYGREIDELEKDNTYPNPIKGKTGLVKIWPLKIMTTFFKLTPEQIEQVKQNSQRHYNYDN
jgi:hypothetical protein